MEKVILLLFCLGRFRTSQFTVIHWIHFDHAIFLGDPESGLKLSVEFGNGIIGILRKHHEVSQYLFLSDLRHRGLTEPGPF